MTGGSNTKWPYEGSPRIEQVVLTFEIPATAIGSAKVGCDVLQQFVVAFGNGILIETVVGGEVK